MRQVEVKCFTLKTSVKYFTSHTHTLSIGSPYSQLLISHVYHLGRLCITACDGGFLHLHVSFSLSLSLSEKLPWLSSSKPQMLPLTTATRDGRLLSSHHHQRFLSFNLSFLVYGFQSRFVSFFFGWFDQICVDLVVLCHICELLVVKCSYFWVVASRL